MDLITFLNEQGIGSKEISELIRERVEELSLNEQIELMKQFLCLSDEDIACLLVGEDASYDECIFSKSGDIVGRNSNDEIEEYD